MKHKEMQAVMFLNDHMIFAESLLSEREQAQLYAALRAYTMEGVLPDMQGRSKNWTVTFNFMRSAQDRYIERYNETCERNRSAANKRWQKHSDSPEEKPAKENRPTPTEAWMHFL